MKNKENFLPLLVASILTFATSKAQDTEKENQVYKIDYYARRYASQNGLDYESIGNMDKEFKGFTDQENALGLAHNFSNPTTQNISDITINLQVTKAFLKTL